MGNKQKDIEATVQLESYSLFTVTGSAVTGALKSMTLNCSEGTGEEGEMVLRGYPLHKKVDLLLTLIFENQ